MSKIEILRRIGGMSAVKESLGKLRFAQLVAFATGGDVPSSKKGESLSKKSEGATKAAIVKSLKSAGVEQGDIDALLPDMRGRVKVTDFDVDDILDNIGEDSP